MSNLQVTVQAPGLDEQIAKLAQFDGIAREELVPAMQRSVITVANRAKENAPVGATGLLRQKISSKVEAVSGSAITGIVGVDIASPYPSVVEFGRQPGSFPPPEALYTWVERVLGVEGPNVAGVAFLVARKIAREGTKGQFFLLRAFASSLTEIGGFFKAAGDRIIARLKTNG